MNRVVRAEARAKRASSLVKPNIVWDLDGVLAEQAWPEVGKPIPWAVDLFREYQRAGHLCIIYTSRDGWHLSVIRAFCEAAGIVPDQIVTGKPLGILVDDLAVNPGPLRDIRGPIRVLCGDMRKLWMRNRVK